MTDNCTDPYRATGTTAGVLVDGGVVLGDQLQCVRRVLDSDRVDQARMQFLHHITDLGLHYSVGFYAIPPVVEALGKVPRQAWRAALDADGLPRDGAQVAELTAYLPDTLTGWPQGMRIIARRERPHPGAQLRLTDADGWRITCFATNTKGWRLADLELRTSDHRR